MLPAVNRDDNRFRAFVRALLYVQLSRCTNAEGIFLLLALRASDFLASGRATKDHAAVVKEYARLATMMAQQQATQ